MKPPVHPLLDTDVLWSYKKGGIRLGGKEGGAMEEKKEEKKKENV
jgi:hypothetical protein